MSEKQIVRKAAKKDIPAVMDIIRQAQRDLKSRGVDQWQDGYPDSAAVRADIEKGVGYVACVWRDGQAHVVGTAAISFETEPTYAAIYDGCWRCAEPYAVIHRIAVADAYRGSGAAQALLECARRLCRERDVEWLRIDTHRDNRVMHRFLKKEGFVRCGSITLAGGAHRFGYDAQILPEAGGKEGKI